MRGLGFSLHLRKYAHASATAIVIAGIVGIFAFYMWQQHRAALDRSRSDLRGFTQAVTSHLSGLFRSVEISLDQIARHGAHCQPIGLMVQPGALGSAKQTLTAVAGLSVLDSSGRVIGSTIPEAIGADRSGRPLFKALAASSSDGFYVDEPFHSNVSGKILIPIGRRLASEGQFCGAIVATIEPGQLLPFYEALGSDARRTVWLLQRSTTIARISGTGKSAWLPGIPQNAEDLGEADVALQGVAHLVAHRKVGNSGLTIAASTPRDHILSTWRRDLILGVAAIAILSGIATLLLWLHRRDQEARIERDEERRSQAETQRLLFETSLDIILVVDEDFAILQASPSIESVLGPKSGNVAGQGLSSVIPAGEAARIEAALAKVKHGETLRDFETVFGGAGPSRCISWSGVWSPAERKYFLVGHDLTDLRQREQMLVLQNQRLDAALENMSQGLAMFDKDQKVIVANDKFATMYGQHPEDVCRGTPLADIVAHRIKVGIYVDATVEDICTRMRDRVSRQTPSYITSKMGDGRTLSVAIQPQPDGGWVTTHLDISERERLKDRLDAAINNMAHGLAMFDRDFKLVLCNKRYLELYQLSPELGQAGVSARELLRRCTENGIYAGRDPDAMFTATRKMISTEGVGYYESRLSDGRVYGISTRPMSDGGLVSTHEDITERRRIEERITHLAHYDGLTGVANRVLICQRLEQDLRMMARLAVLYLDLDRFKVVNDTLGHGIGDKLLTLVAKRLQMTVKEGDLIARIGGDEFAILHYGDDLKTSARALAKRIVSALSTPFEVDGHSLSIGTTIGIALAPEDGEDPELILKHADLALYAAKAEQRGTLSFYDKKLNDRILETQVLELELRAALGNGELTLEYQPIFDLKTGMATACETLLRWRHPRRGLVSPAEFVPIAEHTGLINEIGAWVMKEACQEAAKWPEHIKLAINLSPIQVRTKGLLGIVRKALDQANLPASRLEMEITESALLCEDGHTPTNLQELHAIGVRIALDDFGTGYSSLGYLQRYPFHKIKADRSFVRDLSQDQTASRAILRTIAFLGSALDVITTVEGVETEEQLAYVRAEGFDEVQGFYLCRPVAAAKLPWVLAEAAA